MSHVAAGFTVTDIEALRQTVEENCPNLQLVAQASYRTWIDDHGKLVGDYPVPAIYQLKILAELGQQGIDYDKLAAEQGVKLPENTLDLEKTPWTLDQQNKLLRNPQFKQAYDKVVKTQVGKDAEYVIQHKSNDSMYEIGLVPHPVNPGEYVMICDFWGQGNGILDQKGVGRYHRANGVDEWGHTLKQNYAERATERVIQQQIALGNPEYGSYSKVKLPDGRIQFKVEARS